MSCSVRPVDSGTKSWLRTSSGGSSGRPSRRAGARRSLARMGFDYVNLIYATVPPEGLGAVEIVDSVADLLSAGKARAWGVVNWPPELLAEAAAVARGQGESGPCAAQVATASSRGRLSKARRNRRRSKRRP